MNDEGLKRLARHEATHACLAHFFGMKVCSLSARPGHAGETRIELPFTTVAFAATYRERPHVARLHLQNILSVLVAPSVVLNEPVGGIDLSELEAWQATWEQVRHVRGDLPFRVLTGVARADVRDWLKDPRHQRELDLVARELGTRHFLTSQQFQALVRDPQPRPTAPRPAPSPTTTLSLNREDLRWLMQYVGSWHSSTSRRGVSYRPRHVDYRPGIW